MNGLKIIALICLILTLTLKKSKVNSSLIDKLGTFLCIYEGTVPLAHENLLEVIDAFPIICKILLNEFILIIGFKLLFFPDDYSCLKSEQCAERWLSLWNEIDKKIYERGAFLEVINLPE